MMTIRPSDQRGKNKISWLDTRYTFSFADYYDPNHMQFRSLRVINEDVVSPKSGFAPHDHRDMEIITYILEGNLQHTDSMGHTLVIKEGEVQRMSAGTGVTHSEINPSATESVHLLQIWIIPNKKGLTPSYEQRAFSAAKQHGKLRLLIHPNGIDGALKIHQDALLFSLVCNDETDKVVYTPESGRYIWIQVSKGAVKVDGQLLQQGDGAAISDVTKIEIHGAPSGEILLFDLA